ncbi:hypothetical protein ACVJF0_000207 [Bradyrhizobium elkanii]
MRAVTDCHGRWWVRAWGLTRWRAPFWIAWSREALLSEPEIVVKSKLALARIRAVRYELLAAFLLAPNTMLAKRLRGLARYEREAFARQRRVIRKGMKL